MSGLQRWRKVNVSGMFGLQRWCKVNVSVRILCLDCNDGVKVSVSVRILDCNDGVRSVLVSGSCVWIAMMA